MSLLRLLTAGRSLVSVRDTESRYRLTTQRLLPQFGSPMSPINPFESSAGQVLSSPGTSLPTAKLGEASPKARVWGHARGSWLRVAGLWSACRIWPGVLTLRLTEKPAKQRAIPPLLKCPVQGELSLDRVRVVRNDLSDADLEVMPARTSPAPAGLVGKSNARTEWAWGRVARRLLPAGKAQWGEH